MFGNVSIRPVTKENLASGLYIGSSMEHTHGTRSAAAELARCYLNDDPHPYYVYLDDTPVGFALMTGGHDRTTAQPITKLKLFILDQQYQGKGLAKPALRLLLASTHNDVVLAVHPDNRHAIKIYRDIGFADCYQRGGWNYMILRKNPPQ